MLPFLGLLVDGAALGGTRAGGGAVDIIVGADALRIADLTGCADSGGGTRRGGSAAPGGGDTDAGPSKDTCEVFFLRGLGLDAAGLRLVSDTR